MRQVERVVTRMAGGFMELYDQQTAPLLDWFEARELLETVDGYGGEDEVFERLAETVRARLG